MPALDYRFSHSRFLRVFPALCLLAFLTPLPAAGQNSWLDNVSRYRYLEPIRMTLLLPMDGPGAAILNPARLASTERGYAHLGSWSGGESRSNAFSTGFGFARRFYLGLFFSTSGGVFEGTNAVILNNRFGGHFAYRHPLDAEDRGSLTIGLSEANRMINSLGSFKAISYTADVGALWVPSTYPGGWRLELGGVARDLRPFSETVYNDMTEPRRTYVHVDYAPWMTLATLGAESPAKQWKVYSEAAAGAEYQPAFYDPPLPGWKTGAFNLYMPRLGLRFRPIPEASVALERLWNRYWAAGVTFGTGSWLPMLCEADFRAAQGSFLEYQMPDESGWSLAWNLKVLW
jgi:hypothetical protein